MPPKIPCKVYYSREDGSEKVLVANSTAELEALLRIGWKLDGKP